MRTWLLVALVPLFSPPGPAVDGDRLTGYWINPHESVMINMVRVGGKYYGSMTWLSENKYTADAQLEKAYERNKKLLGKVVVSGLEFNGSSWQEGKLLVPHLGDNYRCYVTMKSPDRIEVTGYYYFRWLCKTETWKRMVEPRPPSNLQ